MTTLSQDELTVLLIAAEGNPMMPIGRWEAPTKALLTKGMLARNCSPQDPTGMHNLTITPAGRAAAAKGEDDGIRDMITVNNRVATGRQETAAAANAIALQLVDLAEKSSAITGDSKVKALREWSKVILAKALERLQ
jgi:hypothetical protein